MDRERLLIGLWAMASACWISLILMIAFTSPAAHTATTSLLIAVAPPAVTIIAGYLIVWALRGPVEPSRHSDRTAP